MTQIYSRKDWGSKYGSNWKRTMPTVNEVFLHTVAVPYNETSLEASFRHLRSIENYHVNTKKWTGIAYSWLIDTQGRIFEGRGIRVRGGHTQGYNSSAYGVCFFGNGDVQKATSAQINGFTELLRYLATDVKAINTNYKVRGHREVSTKSCPGNLVWPLVENGTWAPSNVLKQIPAPPIPPVVGEKQTSEDISMISTQHLYLEAFARFGSVDEIKYWDGEFAARPQEAMRSLMIDSNEAQQNKDDGVWSAKIANLFDSSQALSDIKKYLDMGLMTRAGIVDALLVTTISRQVVPVITAPTPQAPTPGTVVYVDVDKSSVLRIVSDALTDSIGQ